MSSENPINDINEFISADKDINVAEIIDRIQKRIAEKKKSGILKDSDLTDIVEMELLPLPDFQEVPNIYRQHLYPAQMVQPYQPFPHEEEIISGGGWRGLVKKIFFRLRKIIFPLIRFLVRPITNDLIINLHNENRAQIAHMGHMVPVVFQSKEYIIILHNALNNMIVEFTKLKIEEEMLKTKIKMVEDKLEFVENRQRAVEKKLFSS